MDSGGAGRDGGHRAAVFARTDDAIAAARRTVFGEKGGVGCFCCEIHHKFMIQNCLAVGCLSVFALFCGTFRRHFMPTSRGSVPVAATFVLILPRFEIILGKPSAMGQGRESEMENLLAKGGRGQEFGATFWFRAQARDSSTTCSMYSGERCAFLW